MSKYIQKLKKTVVRQPSGIAKMDFPGVKKVSPQEMTLVRMFLAIAKDKGGSENIMR